jgi:hypothetical protein
MHQFRLTHSVDHLLSNSTELPSDKETLQLMVLALLQEREHQNQRAQEMKHHANEQVKQTEQLQVELLRVKLELERYKKWYYALTACNPIKTWRRCC